jgi:hypothetical protein
VVPAVYMLLGQTHAVARDAVTAPAANNP